MNILRILLGVIVALGSALHADTRTSATYSVSPETVDSGGQRAASVSYSNMGSVGLVAGLSTADVPPTTVASGYLAQLASGASAAGVPAITSATTASGTFGSALTPYAVTATNAPTSFGAAGLPGGLSINATSGAITGTPTAAGIFNVTLSAVNAAGTGTATLVFTIAKASQTITFGALVARTMGTAPFALTATASSGLAVSYASSNVAVATVSGATVTIVGAGSTTLTASQAGDANFAEAAAVAQTLTVTPAGVAPAITTPVAAQTVTAGATATFSVVATGDPAPMYRWMRGSVALTNGVQATGAVVAGATSATLTITGTRTADAGSYSVVVSNGVGANATSGAALTVEAATAVTITRQPVSLAVNLGDSATFSVTAVGSVPLSYQWKRGNIAIDGATRSSFTITNVRAADADVYSVIVTNGAGPITSSVATLSLLASGNTATHAVVGGGYIAGGTVTVSNTLTYAGAAAALGWEVLLPDGWSFASANGAFGDTAPVVGTTGLIGFAWSNNVAASPLSFTYTLNVPAGQTGEPVLAALVIVRSGGVPVQFLAKPDPLVVAPLMRHSADTSGDSRIDLIELTRVIELYNVRSGTVRTGRYKVQAGSEDGFATDPGGTTIAGLLRYHSADTNGNGAISLVELTRVIELYNTRAGTVRTGHYHVQAGTEDGFEPGP